jgi:hypothetical protein
LYKAHATSERETEVVCNSTELHYRVCSSFEGKYIGICKNFKCSRNFETLKMVEEEINYNSKALKYEDEIQTQYSGPESKEPTVADQRSNYASSSVADPGCLSWIPDPDFYPSRIPDLGSRISGPGSKNSNKREG